MATQRLRLDPFLRPLIQVQVKPGVARHALYYAHPPNVVPSASETFLIDTGADFCFIDPAVLAGWGMTYSQANLKSVAGRPVPRAYAFDLSLRLGDGVNAPSYYLGSYPVFEHPEPARFQGQPFRGLIGMDLLAEMGLTWDGPTRVFELSWP